MILPQRLMSGWSKGFWQLTQAPESLDPLGIGGGCFRLPDPCPPGPPGATAGWSGRIWTRPRAVPARTRCGGYALRRRAHAIDNASPAPRLIDPFGAGLLLHLQELAPQLIDALARVSDRICQLGAFP